MTTIPLSDTGVLKRVIIDMAFEDCAMSGFDLERSAEEVTTALRRLNTMMLEWPWSALGYVQPAYGMGSADEPSNLPDMAISAVAQYLALRLAPALGLTLQPEQRATLARSRSVMISQLAQVPTMSLPGNTPRGNGQRGYIRNTQPFTGPATYDDLPAGAVSEDDAIVTDG